MVGTLRNYKLELCSALLNSLDKMIGTYSCRRMTAHWLLVIFCSINPTCMSDKQNERRVFLEQLEKRV